METVRIGAGEWRYRAPVGWEDVPAGGVVPAGSSLVLLFHSADDGRVLGAQVFRRRPRRPLWAVQLGWAVTAWILREVWRQR